MAGWRVLPHRLLRWSPAVLPIQVRPPVHRPSPVTHTRLTHHQLAAMLTTARDSVNRFGFTLIAKPGLAISAATGTHVSDLWEEHGHPCCGWPARHRCCPRAYLLPWSDR